MMIAAFVMSSLLLGASELRDHRLAQGPQSAGYAKAKPG